MTKRPLAPGDFHEEEARFARRLKAARKQAGLTHAQLAAITGFGKAYISYVENLRANPSLLTCLRFARALKIDLGDLVSARRIEALDVIEDQ
ncbi:helix-turn-helix domain-containing protein [Sphingomonas oryzagri]|uniref:Helix-turn-helix transcriptional regulator n=1 Tax=Sphingomonas oryzagri TaxID=3042314 RepID=A0ABT6N4V7_9SPHN|nr:helix-turn-helix transcriptional regulator [Sphingomonas oryzagri]MDH7639966.1 helix-turn-helix transcriptional regulator [Sphingomonas oryzagri]